MFFIIPDRFNRYRRNVFRIIQLSKFTKTTYILYCGHYWSFYVYFYTPTFYTKKKSSTLDYFRDHRWQGLSKWIFCFISKLIYLTTTFQLTTVIFWSILSAAAAVVVYRKINGAEKASTVVRKIFHLLAVAVYVPGLLYHCNFLYLATGVVFGIFIILDVSTFV